MRSVSKLTLLTALSATLALPNLASAQNPAESQPTANANAAAATSAPAATPAPPSTNANQPTQAAPNVPPAPASAGANTSVNTQGEATIQSPPAATDTPANTTPNQSAAPSPPPAPVQSPTATAGAAAQAQTDASLRGQVNINGPTAISQQDLSAGLQFGQATNLGLAITTIEQSNFLYTSGLRQGDVLVSYNGRPIRSQADFGRWVIYQPGQRVPVVVLRDGRQETIYVTYQAGLAANPPQPAAPSGAAFLGVTFDTTVPNAAIVRMVTPGGPAESAGLQPGDMIVALNGSRVSSWQEVTQTIGSMQPGQRLDIEFARRATDRTQAVLAARPQSVTDGPPPGIRVGANVQPVPGVYPPPAPRAPDAAATIEGRTVDPPRARQGDTDADGRVIDGDGAINRRGRLIPPRRSN